MERDPPQWQRTATQVENRSETSDFGALLKNRHGGLVVETTVRRKPHCGRSRDGQVLFLSWTDASKSHRIRTKPQPSEDTPVVESLDTPVVDAMCSQVHSRRPGWNHAHDEILSSYE